MFVYMVHIYTKGKTNLLRISVGINDMERERGCLNPVEQASVYVFHCVPPAFGKTVKVQQRGASQRLLICDMKIFAFGKLWIQMHSLYLAYMGWLFVLLFLWREETNEFIRCFVQKVKNTHGLFLYEYVSEWDHPPSPWVLPNNPQYSNLIGPIAHINVASWEIDP